MDLLYRIVGVKAIGDRICLSLKMLKEGDKLSTGKILSNPLGFMESMKQDAMNSRNPDQISITMTEYNKGFYGLGDLISISINGGK